VKIPVLAKIEAMPPFKNQHTLAQRHMRLFACTACDSPCGKFIWQNDKTAKISRRVQLATLEAENWIHDEETEQWVTGIESRVLWVYEQVEQKIDPITLPGHVHPDSPQSIDIRIPLWNYVASIMGRRCVKANFDKAITKLHTPEHVERLAFERCLQFGEPWEIALSTIQHNVATVIKNAKEARGQAEKSILDSNDCPFNELFLYQTLADVALPDIGFGQAGKFVIMPVSPTQVFIGVIGKYRGEFIWPRSDFPVVREQPNGSEDAVTAARINEWCKKQSLSRFLYSRKPIYPAKEDCCPRLRPKGQTRGPC
jgi:hypothetical protein